MSRMVTSVASLSWARPAMRCACSSGVSGSPAPGRRTSRVARGSTTVAVEPKLLDQTGDGRRDQAVDRLAAGDAGAQVAGRDRDRLELEERDAVGAGEPGAHLVEPVVRDARPGRDGEARRARGSRSGSRQDGKSANSSAPRRSRTSPSSRSAQTAVSTVYEGPPRSSSTRESSTPGRSPNAASARRKRVSASVLDRLVRRLADRDDDEPLEVERVERRARERHMPVVRRVERPAEEPDGHRRPSRVTFFPGGTPWDTPLRSA